MGVGEVLTSSKIEGYIPLCTKSSVCGLMYGDVACRSTISKNEGTSGSYEGKGGEVARDVSQGLVPAASRSALSSLTTDMIGGDNADVSVSLRVIASVCLLYQRRRECEGDSTRGKCVAEERAGSTRHVGFPTPRCQ